MAITDLPVLSALRERMQWHQERQRVLAENVANADTPGFRPRDLAAPGLQQSGAITSRDFPKDLQMLRTSVGHLATAGGSGRFAIARGVGFETRPAGNAVNLEDEMLKVASNQMDFAAATTLYSRSLGLLKTAIGRR